MAASRRFAWVVLMACGCDPIEREHAQVDVPLARAPVPTEDRSNHCADVAGVRVCWGAEGPSEQCADSICVEPATLPPFSATTALGWRCTGSGSNRSCVDRRRHAGAFECQGDRCSQPYPRLPDDGEWTCLDTAGAVVCLGGERAAGVVQSPKPDGWFCGNRNPQERDKRAPKEQQICVDLAPDHPDGRAALWSCHYEQKPRRARVCERKPDAHRLGDACDTKAPCVDGAFCVASRCVPRAPEPSCWLDADCPQGVCRFGSCVESQR